MGLEQDLPGALDCTIPQNTELITPEEREELRVSGENVLILALWQKKHFLLLGCLCPGSVRSSHAAFSFSSVKLFLAESNCSSIKNAVDLGKCNLIVQFFFFFFYGFTILK